MAKLKPKEKAYYAHFATAAGAAVTATQELAGLADPGADRPAAAERLMTLARTADDTYRTVLGALRASFVTPFDRTEIQALSRTLAATVRRLEGAGALVHLLDPPALPPEFGAITAILRQAADATADAVDKLRKLKGFKHHHEQITQLAAEAEFHRRLLLVRLTGGEIDPLDAVEIRAVSDELGAAVAGFVDVAEVVETVLITEG